MPLEVELKYRVADLAAVARALEALGAERLETVRQVDRYFAHPARNYAETDEALRLRRVGERNVVTYKGPKLDATTKTRREIELPIAAGGSGFDSWAELLQALGFSPVAEVAKSRTPYRVEADGRGVEIVLDEVDGLGQFVEIETAAEEQDLDAARSAVKRLGEKLGLTQDVRRGYLEMLLAGGRCTGG